MLIIASLVVKIISALYKIPLTSFIGATGRGYFAVAYNIFMPIHIIIMGSMPIALSQLVSRFNANSNKSMVRALKISANKIFFVVGIVGSLLVLLFSVPYCRYIAKSPNSIYTVLALVPTVLFSTLSASYRGFFEGFMNMTPTSVSQTIDAVVKAVFGLLFAKLSMLFLYNSYLNGNLAIFNNITNDKDALSIIYPITTAFAMLGVSLGSLASYLYLVFYSKNHYYNDNHVSKKTIILASKKLITFSFSIMLSCIVQSVFQFLDTASVQLALASFSTNELRIILAESLNYCKIKDNDLYTYIYGLFNSAVDFKNIIPGITMAIGVCAVPAISSAYNTKNKQRLDTVSNMIFKYTIMLSTFCGGFLCLESSTILNLFYRSNADIVVGCQKLVALFGLTAFSYSLAGSAIFCVQAIGMPKKSIPPFVVGGIIRIVINYLFISDITANLYANVIAEFLGYLLIAIWNICIYVKYTNVNIIKFKSVVLPFNVAVLSFFVYKNIINFAQITAFSYTTLIIKIVLYMVIYLVCAIIFRVIDINQIKNVLKFKNHY